MSTETKYYIDKTTLRSTLNLKQTKKLYYSSSKIDSRRHQNLLKRGQLYAIKIFKQLIPDRAIKVTRTKECKQLQFNFQAKSLFKDC